MKYPTSEGKLRPRLTCGGSGARGGRLSVGSKRRKTCDGSGLREVQETKNGGERPPNTVLDTQREAARKLFTATPEEFGAAALAAEGKKK